MKRFGPRYRREDKAAVTDYLFRRTLVGISRPTSFPQLVINTGPKRGFGVNRGTSEPMRINGGSSQLASRYIRSLAASKVAGDQFILA